MAATLLKRYDRFGCGYPSTVPPIHRKHHTNSVSVAHSLPVYSCWLIRSHLFEVFFRSKESPSAVATPHIFFCYRNDLLQLQAVHFTLHLVSCSIPAR